MNLVVDVIFKNGEKNRFSIIDSESDSKDYLSSLVGVVNSKDKGVLLDTSDGAILLDISEICSIHVKEVVFSKETEEANDHNATNQ